MVPPEPYMSAHAREHHERLYQRHAGNDKLWQQQQQDQLQLTEEDEQIASAVEAAVHVQGGVIAAHLLFTSAPDLRKLLADRKLLRFLRCWPERFRITEEGPKEPVQIHALRPALSPLAVADTSQPHVAFACRLLAE